jgi:hypothetical protein
MAITEMANPVMENMKQHHNGKVFGRAIIILLEIIELYTNK